MNKIEQIHRFRPSAGKICIRLEEEYYKNGKTTQIRKIYDNFRFFSPHSSENYHKFFGFERFPHFRDVHLQAGHQFSSFPAEINQRIFNFINFFGFIYQRNTSISTISGEFD